MSRVVLDDHLLRDLLAGDVPAELDHLLTAHEPATTNHYLYRLCKSVVSARGGALTGGWSVEQRRALGSQLITLPGNVEVIPMRDLAYRMAELANEFRVSALGAEAMAASEHLDGTLSVWAGDDGPGIRGAMGALGLDYRTIRR